jgi:hypothetical protein
MRRRRSWRPSGYACSRTWPCGSASSLTCPPSCLRPAPARPASASPPARGGGQANRCHTTVAGGRRGHGPRRRYGLPNGPLRRAWVFCWKVLSDKGGDATTDDHQLATTLVSPTYDSDVASPRPTPASGVGSAYAPPLGVAFRSGACTTSLLRPGSPRHGFPAAPSAARATSHGPSHRGDSRSNLLAWESPHLCHRRKQ